MPPWQDVVLSVGSIVLFVAMCPTIMQRIQIPLGTSLPTAVVLTAFAGVYASLGLLGAFAVTSLTAWCWWILAIRR